MIVNNDGTDGRHSHAQNLQFLPNTLETKSSVAAGNVSADADPLLGFLAAPSELTLGVKEMSALYSSGKC